LGDKGGEEMLATNKPEFSWSFTRHRTLSECIRRYGYSYYFAHGGWKKDAPTLNRHLYRLKTLKNLQMVFGISVHQQIHRLISDPEGIKGLPTEKEILARIRAELNKAYHDSKNQIRWFENPREHNMLMEIYYDNELPQGVIEEYKTKIPKTVKNLLNSETVRDLFQRRNTIQLIAAERFRYLEIKGGIKVWVVMDLLYKDLERDKFFIVDFKTSKQSANDMEQLSLYAKYISETYNIKNLDQIELRNEYLLEGICKTYTPKPFDLEKVEHLIGSSIDYMQSYLHDIENNVPLDLEQFPQNKKSCKHCCFREVCGMS
jgi:hypothetical protein